MNNNLTCKICGIPLQPLLIDETPWASGYLCRECFFTDKKLQNTLYCLIADDVIEIFEQNGFTSDVQPDIELLRHLIVEAIEKRLMK
jgi:hypothetical protein